jgi:hypothetical protein
MSFKQTTCVSIHSFLKFSIFFQPGGPTVKSPARGGPSPHGLARTGRPVRAFLGPGRPGLARPGRPAGQPARRPSLLITMNQHLIFNENIKSYDLNNIFKNQFKSDFLGKRFNLKNEF